LVFVSDFEFWISDFGRYEPQSSNFSCLMKLLLTGISSFTGYWFAKSLVAAGHEVVGTATGSLERYDGVRRARMDQLRPLCRIIPDAPFGNATFLKLLRDEGPWDLLCHHGAEAANYKSPDYDAQQALANNTLNLRTVLAALKDGGGKGVLLTGSVFENDEGVGNEPMRAFSPYGLAKGLTWQVFRFYCDRAGVPLGKFVIPNPFGPWEEPRFTAYLMKTWKAGQTAQVKTPDYVRDNIHVDLLALAYVRLAEQITLAPTVSPPSPLNAKAQGSEGGKTKATPTEVAKPSIFSAPLPLGASALNPLRLNPSGYVETQGAFATRLAREVRQRINWPCALELLKQEDFGEPLARTNTTAVAPLFPNWNESAAWDDFVRFYTG
jgi:nucleoside-diphosphate-sugar epimerase